MRRFSGLTLLLVLLLGLARSLPAAAEDLQAVRLAQYATMDKLTEALPGHAPLHDLWWREKNGKFELLAGIFPDQHHAELLLARLRQGGRPGEIVATAMPEERQWLPRLRSITLSDLGHERPLLLQGVTPYLELHFPWQEHLSTRGAVLRLDLHASQVLRKESTVTIAVEGVPQITLAAAELGQRPELTLRLDAFDGQRIGPELDVTVSGSLVASDDRCLDLRNKGMWLTIGQGSALQLRQPGPPRSLRQFFAEPAAQFTLPQTGGDNGRIEAACRLAGLIGSLARSDRPRVRLGDYAIEGHNIFIEPQGDDARVLGSNLYVTPAGAALLASRWFPALVFSRLSGKSRPDDSSTGQGGITFEAMGHPSRSARGTGDLVFSVDFTTLQLGGWPDKLLCTLHYTHTPVMEHNQAFVRVRMNGVLVESQEIFGAGTRRSLIVALPTQYFQAKNTLELIFSSYHKTGDCMGSYPELEIALLQDSFFTVTDTNPEPPLTLTSYPAIFTGKGALVLGAPAYVSSLIRLVELQGFQQQQAPDLSLVDPARLAEGGFRYAVLALDAAEAEAKKPPLDLGHKLIVKNPLSEVTLLELDTNEPVIALQTFYGPDKLPLLLYTQRHTEQAPLDTVTEMLSSQPQGNVGIVRGKEHYSLEIGKKLRAIYPEKRNFALYWMQYRLQFFILIGALLFFALLYLYHRLAKER
ncbi:MAG: hypothetical protein BWK76_19165 [Desulfobulbaceae bacterium A2]|nr:MAG: hypothetical protein BWK76_19165 [Desulfobulbaceae bacterium A2]